MRKIDLFKSMRTFVMVADKGSFSAAARELDIVTSAVSKQVVDLEAYFATQMLYRTTRAMHLTSEGEYYLEQFKEIIGRIENLEDVAQQREQKISGHITISAPQGSATLGYLDAVSAFIKRHPELRVSWLFVNRFVNMVEEGIDLSIRVGELADSGLIARRYTDVKVHYVASPDYLSRHGEPENPKQLLHHQCIVDSSNRFPKRWRFQHQGQEETVTVNAFIQANDGEVAAKFAADGHGVAYLPTFLMQAYLDRGELQPILRQYEFEAVPVSLVFPANRLMNPALRALIEHLLEDQKREEPA